MANKKRGQPPFLSSVYYSSSQKSSPISKYERAFEVIKRMKEIVRKH
jgi:hypothetical protein